MKRVFLLMIICVAFSIAKGRAQSSASVCFPPVDLEVSLEPEGTEAFVSWNNGGVPTATHYEFAVTTDAQPPAQGSEVDHDGEMVYGLTLNVQYYLHVRTFCSAEASPWSTLPFIPVQSPPPPNDDISGAITLPIFPNGCQNATLGATLSATPSPNTPFPVCGKDSSGWDDDVWFQFTPVAGQSFVTIEFAFINGDIGLVAQMYTTSDNTPNGELSLYRCSDDDGDGALPGFYSLRVTPGTTYFIRVFTYSKDTWSRFTICAEATTLVNDEATGAITIEVDEPCPTAIYDNIGATQSANEPWGGCSSTRGHATAWYKFIAPIGGAVKISTATGSGNTLTNSRIALFAATDPADYSTFTIIACDEDGGSGNMDKMSVLYATGLTADYTYYIQVDKLDNTIADGTFALTVEALKTSMLSTTNRCNGSYQTPVGTIDSYKGWVSLMDEESKLVALVRNPSGAPANVYSASQNVYPGVVRKDQVSGEYYLNRCFTFNSPSGSSCQVQLFFLSDELSALASMDRAAQLPNLRVARQPASSCQSEFDPANGTVSELTQTGWGMINDVNWISIVSSGYSNFYIHAIKSYLTAKVFLQGAYNPALGRHKDVTPAWANVLNTYAKNQPYNTTAYEGYGGNVTGGKGYPLVHVTNLNASGPGSLRDALGSNRTIVFDVGGTISDFHWEAHDVNNLTIDGFTAPPPGITLDATGQGDALGFLWGSENIIVRNIRVRNAGNDGISVIGSHDIVFDHVSSANNGDGDLDITQGSYNITAQWSIFGHSGSGAMLIAFPGTEHVSVHHNLFNSTGPGPGERNPLVHNADNYVPVMTNSLMCDFRNNIVWKWGQGEGKEYGYGSGVNLGGTLQAINNFYQSPSGTEHAIIRDEDSLGAKLYAAGNVSGNPGVNPNINNNMPTAWPAMAVSTESACLAAVKVLANAGPRPLDSVDQVLVNAVSLANCPGAQDQAILTAGTESISGTFLSTPATTDIVDWVLVEIKNSAGRLVATRSAFVREDGEIVDLDGVSPVALYGLQSGLYYITIRHRNHLGISTQNLLLFTAQSLGMASPSPRSFDFTTASDASIFGDSLAYRTVNGVNVMISGNANGNSNVRYQGPGNDNASTIVFLNNITSGTASGVYNGCDVNMDGVVRYQGPQNDRAWILGTVLNGVTSATVTEQRR